MFPPAPRRTSQNTAKNFKRPKNREDNSDLDDFLTETFAAMKTRIPKKTAENFKRPKNREDRLGTTNQTNDELDERRKTSNGRKIARMAPIWTKI